MNSPASAPETRQHRPKGARKPAREQRSANPRETRADDAEEVEDALSSDAQLVTPSQTSGVLADDDDTGTLPVKQPGLPVSPEELAQQFLRDATQQDNFESRQARQELPTDPSAELLEPDASLEDTDGESRNRRT